MKKVVYIFFVPLTRHFEKMFLMADLKEAGFDIELWDLANIYFKDVDFIALIERDYIKKLDSLQAVEDQIRKTEIRNTVFIFLIPLFPVFLSLYRLFWRYNCTIYKFALGFMPHDTVDMPMPRKALKYLRRLFNVRKNASYIFRKAQFLLYRRLKLIKDYDVVFAAGSMAASMYEKYSKVIPINYYDYDNYFRIRDDRSRLVGGDYCVFLDTNLPYDSDFKALKLKTVTPDAYYKALNRFFDLVEKKHGMEVVIAASPKSAYADGLFGKRRVYKYKTNELVKDCSFVIADYSTSIAYAVLYKKPIIFYFTDEIRNLSYFEFIKKYAAILGCNLYDIDSPGDVSRFEVKPADLKKYDDYKYAYLTSKESENRNTKDIVLDHLKSGGASS